MAYSGDRLAPSSLSISSYECEIMSFNTHAEHSSRVLWGPIFMQCTAREFYMGLILIQYTARDFYGLKLVPILPVEEI
ncbi:hypothetical protein AYI69_g2738 [Smittium culicis]|uniref:Uncharacterized protein n=1 Tax=Smittium culicis TaxID=133412 RepID=A0A1R1YLW9_9FUNG|nr:hypothetical protein AYI69_g2738 [Smittium culicis]